ncbi:HotDog domain-containing protein [Annulohypoxylon maeteangense]|uniref:HotDog domain-containing protein n=1 Tax=Annulohypoxylon maeteangense TaxID=1927788 RepID=UPI002007BA77|nr:HotDog domain-containing protein [Annulohypoxylon maeteangense]KAI0882664.1 HotDog domain-containing protein [Annulohypoxylon maeteangense]
MSKSPEEKGLPSGLAHLENTKSFEGIEKVKAFLEWDPEIYKDPKNHEWMSAITPYISILSYSSSLPHPSITFKFTVHPIHSNGLNNLHGGCASTIFDACTTMVLHLISKPGFWQYSGVSRTLNVTYLRPVPVGTTVHIKCDILHAGRNLCALRGEMRSVDEDGRDGPLLVVCEHGKANTDPPAEKL